MHNLGITQKSKTPPQKIKIIYLSYKTKNGNSKEAFLRMIKMGTTKSLVSERGFGVNDRDKYENKEGLG